MAFSEDEDIDYDKIKRERAADREEIRDIENSFKLNLGTDADKFIALLGGQYHTTPLPGESDKIRKPIQGAEKIGTSWHGNQHYDNSVYENPGRIETKIAMQPIQPQYMIPEKYAEVIEALDRFKFSEDEATRKKQMSVVASGIRQALQELIIEDVAVNTKKLFGENVTKIVSTPGGLKVNYKFKESECYVVAKGLFFGDETVCLHERDGRIVAGVYRIDGVHTSDLSANFDISVSKKQ